MVLRKKRIQGREKMASVSLLEGWCKRRGEKTGKSSRKGMNAEEEK